MATEMTFLVTPPAERSRNAAPARRMNRTQAIARLEAQREIGSMYRRGGPIDRAAFLFWRDDVATTLTDADRFAPDFAAQVRAVGDSDDVHQAIATVMDLIGRAILTIETREQHPPGR